MRLQDLVQGELHEVPIVTLLTLSALPICLVYPVLDAYHLTHHNCIHCPQIFFPGTLGPAYEFYLLPTGENLPSSVAQPSSSSSSVAGLQSSCWQSDFCDSNNPHSSHLCFEEGSVWKIKSRNLSNPNISPQVYCKELGSDGETKGSKCSSSIGKGH